MATIISGSDLGAIMYSLGQCIVLYAFSINSPCNLSLVRLYVKRVHRLYTRAKLYTSFADEGTISNMVGADPCILPGENMDAVHIKSSKEFLHSF